MELLGLLVLAREHAVEAAVMGCVQRLQGQVGVSQLPRSGVAGARCAHVVCSNSCVHFWQPNQRMG